MIFLPNGAGITLSSKAIKSQTSFILEDPGAGTNVVNLVAPTLSGDWTFTFPTTGGTNNYVLTTNGSGVTTWAANPSGSVIGPGSATDTAIVRFNGTSGLLVENSGVLIDGSNNITGVVTLTSSGALRSNTSLILEDPGAGTNTTTIHSATLASSYAITLPVDAGTSGQVLSTDGTGVLSWTTAATGDVHGPGSATDTAIARFNGTTGKIIENSGILIDASNNVTGVLTLISTGALRSNTSLILEDPGAGTNTTTIQSATLGSSYTITLPTTAGTNNYVLTTNGSGVTTWAANPSGGIIGPGSSTDRAIVIFNGTTGQLAQNSVVTITSGGIINTSAAEIDFNSVAVLKTISADKNVSVGELSMPAPTASTGIQDTAVGYNALHALTTSVGSTGVGYNAGALVTSGNHNTLIGNAAGAALTTQSGNTIIGYNAGLLATSAQNTMIGDQAGAAHTNGTGATYLGWKAGNAVSTSANNTLLGNGSGLLTTGANNTYVGNSAGATGTSAHDNTVIGNTADVGAGNNYCIVLGTEAVATASNTLVIGSATGGHGITTTTTGGTTNGTATALTLLPLGYLPVKLNGTVVNIPYYSPT